MELAGPPQALPETSHRHAAEMLMFGDAIGSCLTYGMQPISYDVPSHKDGKMMGKPKRISAASADSQSTPALDQHQTATYIADASLGLRNLARQADLTFLTYLLDMVVQEALERAERRRKFRDNPT